MNNNTRLPNSRPPALLLSEIPVFYRAELAVKEEALKGDGGRCLCCSEAEAAAWIGEVAELALAGDEDQVRLLPDVCDHYLGYTLLHLHMSHQAFMRIVEALNGELIE